MPIIKPNSVLRKVSNQLHTKVVLFVDGIRYSVEILDLSYERLTKILDSISSGPLEADEIGPLIVDATANAWAFIDSGHRLRELVQQLPGLNQKTPEVQIFLRRTNDLEDLRHFVQHFRTGIDEFVGRQMPLWGTICWSKVNLESGLPESHTIVPGTFYHQMKASTCTFDRHKFEFVDKIALHAGPKKVDLAKMYARVADFIAWFEFSCAEAWGDAEHHDADIHFMATIKPLTDEETKIVNRGQIFTLDK